VQGEIWAMTSLQICFLIQATLGKIVDVEMEIEEGTFIVAN
jgi:hypothetical protein